MTEPLYNDMMCTSCVVAGSWLLWVTADAPGTARDMGYTLHTKLFPVMMAWQAPLSPPSPPHQGLGHVASLSDVLAVLLISHPDPLLGHHGRAERLSSAGTQRIPGTLTNHHQPLTQPAVKRRHDVISTCVCCPSIPP